MDRFTEAKAGGTSAPCFLSLITFLEAGTANTLEIRDKIRSGEIVEVKVIEGCHSFITEGRIQHLGDCTSGLAGQAVDLPDWEASWSNW